MRYVIFFSRMKPSKIKGDLPDVEYQYISNDSMIPCHYAFTRDIKDAELFDESEIGEAKEIAEMLNMNVKRLEI